MHHQGLAGWAAEGHPVGAGKCLQTNIDPMSKKETKGIYRNNKYLVGYEGDESQGHEDQPGSMGFEDQLGSWGPEFVD